VWPLTYSNCKSLWIKASAKWINVKVKNNILIFKTSQWFGWQRSHLFKWGKWEFVYIIMNLLSVNTPLEWEKHVLKEFNILKLHRAKSVHSYNNIITLVRILNERVRLETISHWNEHCVLGKQKWNENPVVVVVVFYSKSQILSFFLSLSLSVSLF